MSRILFFIFFIAAATTASTQSQSPSGRDVIAVRPGDIALAGFLAPVRGQAIHATAVDNSGSRIGACAGRGRWKCVVGGSLIGAMVGGLLGQALSPQEKDQTNYGCSGFFGCGYYNECVKNCDEPVTRTWVFGIGGAVAGGMAGYYLSKPSR